MASFKTHLKVKTSVFNINDTLHSRIVLVHFLTRLARFKPSGFNSGLNQVVSFLKKPIGLFGFFPPPRKIQFFLFRAKISIINVNNFYFRQNISSHIRNNPA